MNELEQNKYFNAHYKNLIMKCCKLLEHLYYLETHMEFNKELRPFHAKFRKMHVDVLAKRIKDIGKENHEEDFRIMKARFSKMNFEYFDDFKLIHTELLQNNMLLNNLENSSLNFISFYSNNNK